MNNGEHHRINSPGVIHQLIDGEVVVINLDTGHYYSLTATAARIWSGIDSGAATHEIAAQLQVDHTACPEDCVVTVKRFIDELRAENLIAPVVNGADRHAIPEKISSARSPFVPPELKKFTDMRELLLLDPVHEVGETGWPHLAGENKSDNHARG